VPAPRPDSQGVQLRTYDADRNLTALQVRDYPAAPASPTTQTITTNFRSDHRQASVLPPYGGNTTFGYDAVGRQISQTELVSPGANSAPVTRTTLWTYDIAGNQLSSELPNGMRSELQYDVAGRVSREKSLKSGVLESDVTFTYAVGRLTRAQDVARGFDELYGYDSSGRANSVTYSLGESASSAFDLRSRRTSTALMMPGGALATPRVRL
jgi:YD repeat-containing protein